MKPMTHFYHKKRSYTPASTLFVMPSFLRGAAKSIDLWGLLDDFRYSNTEQEADEKSIERDYYIAMSNLSEAQVNCEWCKAKP